MKNKYVSSYATTLWDITNGAKVVLGKAIMGKASITNDSLNPLTLLPFRKVNKLLYYFLNFSILLVFSTKYAKFLFIINEYFSYLTAIKYINKMKFEYGVCISIVTNIT